MTPPTITSAAGRSNSSSEAVAVGRDRRVDRDPQSGTKPNVSRQPAAIIAATAMSSGGSTHSGSVSHCAPHTSAARSFGAVPGS